jgi:superfamily II DNA or RNA helicase
MPNKTILNKKGYIIYKKYFDPKLILEMKRELTVQPFQKMDFGFAPPKYPVYLENKEKLCLPRYYGLAKLGKPDKTNIQSGSKINLKFKGKPKPRQEPIIKTLLEKIKKYNGGILSVPCGFGKTVIALYLISKLGLKPLIIVHKTFLLNQWKERIRQFLPDAKIGYIQQNKIDVDGKDIVIGMLQSISQKDYDPIVFKSFGFCIIDEVHHISSRVFSRALPKITCKYTFGLSATPKREDRTEKIFHWYLGPMLYSAERKKVEGISVRIYKYNSEHKDFKSVISTATGKENAPRMVTNISKITERNQFIIDLINGIKEEAPTRQVLILGERLEQLRILQEWIVTEGKHTSGYYIGGMKEKDLKVSETKEILFATFSMAAEGLDIPTLDTLMMITPRSNIEQSVGRILRKDMDKYENAPLIVDMVDELRMFKNQSYKRRRLYKKMNYKFEFYDVVQNKIHVDEKSNKRYKHTPLSSGKSAPVPEEKEVKKNDELYEGDMFADSDSD